MSRSKEYARKTTVLSVLTVPTSKDTIFIRYYMIFIRCNVPRTLSTFATSADTINECRI